jgi:hypothetical protein
MSEHSVASLNVRDTMDRFARRLAILEAAVDGLAQSCDEDAHEALAFFAQDLSSAFRAIQAQLAEVVGEAG